MGELPNVPRSLGDLVALARIAAHWSDQAVIEYDVDPFNYTANRLITAVLQFGEVRHG